MADRDVRTAGDSRHATSGHLPDPVSDLVSDPVTDDASGEPTGEPGPNGGSDPADGTGEPVETLEPLGTLVLPELPDDFVTEAQLAGQDAEAARLRELAAETRRMLDASLPASTPTRRPDRRKRLAVAALVAGGTAGVIAAGVLVPWSDLGSGHRAVPPAGQAGRASAAAAAGQAAAAPAAFRPPPGVLPATGPGVSQPGSVLTVRVLANGDLSVVEQAVLGPRGLRAVRLALPSTASLGGQAGQMRPEVGSLRASVNDQGAAVRSTGDGWTVAVAGPRARTVRLSYTLSGVTLRSTPSKAHRAISVLLPLLSPGLRQQGLPMTVRTYATSVNAVTCPGAQSAEVLCGMQGSRGWSATIPASATVPALLMSLTL